MADKHFILTTPEGPAPIWLIDIHGDESEYAQATNVIATPASSFPDASTISNFSVDDDPQIILAPASTTRLGVTIHNHSDDDLYISLGDTVTDTLFTQVMRMHSYYELPLPVYRGPIVAVRPAGSALSPVLVTELFKNGGE